MTTRTLKQALRDSESQRQSRIAEESAARELAQAYAAAAAATDSDEAKQDFLSFVPESTLKTFLISGIKLTHIYQPVVIRTLLQHDGETDIDVIAEAILDATNINGLNPGSKSVADFRRIARKYPLPILETHGIIEKTQHPFNGPGYRLTDFASLECRSTEYPDHDISQDQVKHYCDRLILQFAAKKNRMEE